VQKHYEEFKIWKNARDAEIARQQNELELNKSVGGQRKAHLINKMRQSTASARSPDRNTAINASQVEMQSE